MNKYMEHIHVFFVLWVCVYSFSSEIKKRRQPITQLFMLAEGDSNKFKFIKPHDIENLFSFPSQLQSLTSSEGEIGANGETSNTGLVSTGSTEVKRGAEPKMAVKDNDDGNKFLKAELESFGELAMMEAMVRKNWEEADAKKRLAKPRPQPLASLEEEKSRIKAENQLGLIGDAKMEYVDLDDVLDKVRASK
jgi:hypothetical protein